MALVALRCAHAPTKTVSVLLYVLHPSWPVTMFCSVFWLNVVVCMLSSWTCRSPELHRNPGHVSQSQLERPAREERHPHRYLSPPFSDFSWSSGCLLNNFLSCACRVSHFLGGIQQNKHSRHALPAQYYTGVQGHRTDRAHYLHYSGGQYDLQRSRSPVVLHHFLWCAARWVSSHVFSYSRIAVMQSCMSSFSCKNVFKFSVLYNNDKKLYDGCNNMKTYKL